MSCPTGTRASTRSHTHTHLVANRLDVHLCVCVSGCNVGAVRCVSECWGWEEERRWESGSCWCRCVHAWVQTPHHRPPTVAEPADSTLTGPRFEPSLTAAGGSSGTRRQSGLRWKRESWRLMGCFGGEAVGQLLPPTSCNKSCVNDDISKRTTQ